MSAELIERLRDENARNGGQGAYAWVARELCGKAADLLTTQAAEIAELRAKLEKAGLHTPEREG